MGNCLSGCTARTPSQNGGETVISYSGGKFYQTRKESAPALDAKAQSTNEREIKEFAIVQKELEALRSQITHSQAVLASLKFTFLEQPKTTKKNADKVHRTTQTFQDSQPKSLENVSTNRDKNKEWCQLTSSCPALVHNIAVQTEFVEVGKHNLVNDAEYFLPPIGASLDLKGLKELKSTEPPNSIDLDIYRSCRKLSVLPEEECVLEDSPPGSRLLPKFPDQQQAHSFESYLLPVSSSSPHVMRQLSDPTTSRSTRRPLQVSSCSSAGDQPRVQDSGLGSELRISSPTFTTLQDTLTQLVTISFSSDPDIDIATITLKMPETPFKTPSDVTPNSPKSSSDTSLSFQTPTEITPENDSPVDKISLTEKIIEPEKPLLSVLLDDKPLIFQEFKESKKDSLTPDNIVLDRVPSRRRLVRSLARIGSEMPPDLPFDENEKSESHKEEAELNDLERKEDKEMEQQNQSVFPSLSDSALRQLGLWMQSNAEDKDAPVTEEEIDHKYTSLVLAFKTDKLTLARRLELQNKLRDQAEINVTYEVDALKTAIQSLNSVCTGTEKNELFEKVRQQVETLYNSTLRVSSTAELYGAVQQEIRLSKAVDLILKHVENLKHMYEKERTEHEETRKLLKDSNKTPQNLTVASLKNDGKRRASIATLHQGQNLPEQANTAAERRGSSSRRGSHIRRSTFTKTDSQGDLCKNSCSDEGQLNKICEQGRCGSNNNHLLTPKELCDSGDSHLNTSECETESEDEFGYKQSELRHEAEALKKLPQRYKFRKRSSFCAPPWMLRMMTYLQWLQPYENYALQARYFIAGLFVFFAIAIVSSSFFVTLDA